MPENNTRIKVPEHYLSAYLLQGFREECYDLFLENPPESQTTLKNFRTIALFRRFHEDSPGYTNPLGIHLSHIAALNIVSQSVVSYYCLMKRMSKQSLGEFVGRSFSIEMNKPIPLDGLEVTVDIESKNMLGIRGGTFCKWNYSINNGSFKGHLTGILPFKI